ncbi:MAG TPA: hypothetical protein VJ934_04755 [Desulfomicrobiaceae bacterium]|nr:hypothetical protein [Desulfomicrobiaceae bacterium]
MGEAAEKILPFEHTALRDQDYAGLAMSLTRPKSPELPSWAREDREEAAAPRESVLHGNHAEAADTAATGPARRDLTTISMTIAAAAVVLMCIFYFSLNQQIQGLQSEVRTLSAMQPRVSTLETQITDMDARVTALQDLPSRTRQMVLRNTLEEMAHQAAFLGTQLGDEAQNAKLQEARKLMQQVQGQLSTIE